MRVDGLHNTQVGTQGDASLSGTTQQSGSWRGETLSVQKSTASLLADAAEELTFAQAEREEEKEISERRIHGAGPTTIPQIQEIMEYLDQMGEPNDQAKLQELTAKLAAAGGAGAGEAAAALFGDVSKQFLALSHALHHFEGEGADPEAAAAIREALEDLHDDRGPEIRAGLNSAGAAQAFAEGDTAQADSFRECYRETVLGREALGETFNSVLQRFGADDVSRSIGFLVRAAGDDLAARGPSTAPAELKSIMEDLYQLEVLATVLDGCNDIAAAMQRDFSVTSVNPGALMQKLVGLTGERWLTSDRVSALPRDMGIFDPEAAVSFLTRVKGVVRDLPLKVFNDPESRNKLMSVTQEALDLAIEEEEE
jgi:type III secretion protein W